MKLRPATIKDAYILWLWRQDPYTRLASVNIASLQFKDHVAWLALTLEYPKKIFIAQDVDLPVGMMRFDAPPHNYTHSAAFEVSWCVAPEARGQGYGKEMVRLGCLEFPTGTKFIARIKPWNQASLKIAKYAHIEAIEVE